MAVEENASGVMNYTATPGKTPVFAFVLLSETRLRLWNSLMSF